MEIYLIDRETKEIKDTYKNASKWAENFIEYIKNGFRTKIYCDIETEYFTNKILEDREIENGLNN